MPKYYVQSGNFKKILNAPDSETAALTALESLANQTDKLLSNFTTVSEIGFFNKTLKKDDEIYTTLELLEQVGLLGKFKPEEWI